MEANKLMTGDWVLIKRTPSCEYPYKICSINNYSILGEDYADWIEVEAGEEINLEDIKPIPLTAEILEKNGFEVQDQGGGRKDVWIGFGIDCEGDIEVEFQNNIPIHLKIDGGFKGEYYTSTNIKYVHELQHALRLCGIDKEIVL